MRMKSILKILCTLVLITGLTACVPKNKHENDNKFDPSTIHPAGEKNN